MTPQMGWSRAESSPAAGKCSTSPHSPRAPWLCMHSTGTLRWHLQQGGQAEGPGAASLGYPHLLWDMGAAAAPWMHSAHW